MTGPVGVAEWLERMLAAPVEDANMVAIAALRDGIALERVVCEAHGGRVMRWTGLAQHLRETGRHEPSQVRPWRQGDPGGPVPWETARCRSCGARIVWARTVAGRMMPVNVEPAAAGNVLLVPQADPTDPPLARVLHTEAERAQVRDAPLHLAHFASCTHADEHRKPKGGRR